MTEWQPIETAPRDGTQILVLVAPPYDDRATFHLVTWGKGWTIPDPRFPDQPACWWANENGANYHEPYVQKWMPLPAKAPLDPTPRVELKTESFAIFGGAGVIGSMAGSA